MLLLKLVLFIGMFLGITYGMEFLLPPFGAFYYTNPLDILISLSYSLSYKVGFSTKVSLVITIIIISIVPFIVTFYVGKLTKRKKQIKYKYRFK